MKDLSKLHYKILERILSLPNSESTIIDTLDTLAKSKGYDEVFKVLDLIDINIIKDSEFDDDNMPMSTKKNIGVRNYNRNLNLTNTQYAVLWRCKNDVEWFIANYIKINNPAKRGYTLMTLRRFQRVMIHAFEQHDMNFDLEYQDANDWENPILDKVKVNFKNANRIVCKISRQMGKSTLYYVYLMWRSIFFDDQRLGLIANKAKTAKEILRGFQKSYSMLPLWMQRGVKTWNKFDIELENGSTIMTSGQSEDAFTGFTFNVLIMDEVAKWNSRMYNAITDSLFPTVDAYGKYGKIIMVTTPFGDNFFKDLWISALNNIKSRGRVGSIWYPIEGTYRDDEMRNNRSWVLNKIKEKGKRSFAQEQEGRFLSISGTLISGDVLSLMKPMLPLEDQYLKDVLPKYERYISQFFKPIEKHVYIVVLDPNESVDKHKRDIQSRQDPDGIGIQVIDITDIEKGWEQTVSVNIPGGDIHYLETDIICFKLAEYYNNANIFIENNLGGKIIAQNIETKFEYDNVYFEKELVGGYRLTTEKKFMLGSLFKFAVEHGALNIHDEDTIAQLKFFKENMKALVPMHDDLILPLLGAFYFLLLPEDEILDLFEDDNDLKLTSAVNIKEKILSSSNNEQEKNTSHLIQMVQILDDLIADSDLDVDDVFDIDDTSIIC